MPVCTLSLNGDLLPSRRGGSDEPFRLSAHQYQGHHPTEPRDREQRRLRGCVLTAPKLGAIRRRDFRLDRLEEGRSPHLWHVGRGLHRLGAEGAIVRCQRHSGPTATDHPRRVELLWPHGIEGRRGQGDRRPDGTAGDLFRTGRRHPAHESDRRLVVVLRPYHRRQLGRLPARDPVLHRQSDV